MPPQTDPLGPVYGALLELAGALDALAAQIDLDALPEEGESAIRSARIAYAALVVPSLHTLEALLDARADKRAPAAARDEDPGQRG